MSERGRERSEAKQSAVEPVSEVSERARERSGRAKRCMASERSEWCKRTNKLSDRVARLKKRDCL